MRPNFNYLEATRELVDYYYSKCPGSLMPLFLLYLARKGKTADEYLFIDEKIRKPLDWNDNPQKRYCSPILSQFTQKDAAELARLDPAGAHLLDRWQCNEMDHMSIVVFYSGTRMQEIREAFQKHDEERGDTMKKRRALFLLVQGLVKCPSEILARHYLDIADHMLRQSRIFDGVEDLPLSRFIRRILGDVKGPVFVPFSQAPYAAAMLTKASVYTESYGPSAALASMVSELLLKGNGAKRANCAFVEKPYLSLGDIKYDGVILTCADHNERTDATSWHQCLKILKNNLSEKAKYVGLIETKYLFKMVGKQALFKEIISDGSLESIILLPRRYGLALISVNKAKKQPEKVKMVNLYNERTFNCSNRYFLSMISRNSKTVTIQELAKDRTTIDSFFEESVPPKEGFQILPLGKCLKRIRKESLFGVSDSTAPDHLSVVEIGKEETYSPYRYMVDSRPVDSFSIYEPSYYLDTWALLVNRQGSLEARLYQGDQQPAIFADGLAFAVSPQMWPPYLINELRKPYVEAQLNRWSASKDQLHSEDEILDLKIYVPDCEDADEAERKICKKELDENILTEGTIVFDEGRGSIYTIEKCLGKGGFGISYRTTKESFWNGESETVVLKEFFASGTGEPSERFDGHRVALAVGSIENIRRETDLHSYLVKFIDEAETMQYFSRFPGCRVRPARNIFQCYDTNTYYYEMDYFARGTLMDEVSNYGCLSEEKVIERVMKPIAIALDTMHHNHWLHLDIKPSNIVIDDEGLALLGDLGISQHYDDKGNRITKGGGEGTKAFCCLKQYDRAFTEQFHPELDIFSFAALMYFALTGNDLVDFSPRKLNSSFLGISDQTRNAIKKALDPNLKTTPASVRDFIHLLPGCENLVFEDIQPIEFDPDLEEEDPSMSDIEDMPDFT